MRAHTAALLLLAGTAAVLAAPDGAGIAPAATGGAAPAPLTRTTPAFTSVRVETPFNVRIEPGKGHALALDAEEPVVKAVGFKVEGGELIVTTDNTFKTDKPVKLTIQLPASDLASVTVNSRKATVVLADGFRPAALKLAVGAASRLVVHGARAASTVLTASGTSVTLLDGDLGDVDITATEAALVTGAFKVKKLTYVGDGSAVLDVGAAPTHADVTEAPGGSARVVPGGTKDKALYSVDWTCGAEVAATSGQELSARATADSKFTRGADCESVTSTGAGGRLLCFASTPCAYTDDGHVALYRVPKGAATLG